MSLAFWRHAVALVILLPFIMRPIWTLRLNIIRQRWTLIGIAASGIVLFNIGTYSALQSISAVRSVMIFALSPVMILILSRLLIGTRLTHHQIAGVIISFIGIGIVEIKDSGSASALSLANIGTGDVWMAAATLGFALNTVLVRQLSKEIPSLVAYGVAVFFGVLFMAPIYLMKQNYYLLNIIAFSNVEIIFVILFLSLGPSIIGYLCWYYAIRIVGPHRVGNFILLVPLFGAILGVVFLSEHLTGALATGGAMVFGGIVLSFVDAADRAEAVLSDSAAP